MNKKIIVYITLITLSLIIVGTFLFCDLGLGLTPLTKFFVVFFGVVLGFQCIPAILLFTGMIKGIFARSDVAANQVSR